MQIITFIRAAKKLLYILNSLLFDGAAHYLTRTPLTAGNRKTWTFSVWVRFTEQNNINIFNATERPYSGSGERFNLLLQSTDTLNVQANSGGSSVLNATTNTVFRDYSAWYHIVVAIDTTQATAADRAKLWVNGTQQTFSGTPTYPSQNADLAVNGAFAHHVGVNVNTSDAFTQYFDGLMALPILVDGAALTASDFGETDANGYWMPKEYSGSYGTNGGLYNFSNSSHFGEDQAGSNDFTDSGFATTDQLTDTPTDDVTLGIGNFATLNPDTSTPNWTFSNGNLTVTNASESNHRLAYATQAVEEGKFYWEVTIPSAPFIDSIGVINMDIFADGVSAYLNTYGCGWGYSTSVGRWDAGGGWSSSGSAPPALTSNGVIGIALDCDNDKLWFRNASGWINSGDPAAGTGENFNRLTKFPVAPAFSKYYNAGAYTFNFGQKAFTYTPPTGFSKLATQNLPAGHPLYVAGAAQLRAGVQVMSQTLNADSGGNADYHFRTEIVAAQIVDHSFTRVRIRMEAASVEACEIDAIYIGTKAGSGNAWDYAGDQVQVTVNGNGAFTIPAGTEIWSDWIEFSGDGTDALIVGWDHSSNTAADGFRQVTGTGIFNRWGKSATDAAATTAPSGLTLQSGTLGLVNAIEVQ